MQPPCDTFENLAVKRNALIDAYPLTDADGSPILGYQKNLSRLLPEMKWLRAELEASIHALNSAACEAGGLIDRLG